MLLSQLGTLGKDELKVIKTPFICVTWNLGTLNAMCNVKLICQCVLV